MSVPITIRQIHTGHARESRRARHQHQLNPQVQHNHLGNQLYRQGHRCLQCHPSALLRGPPNTHRLAPADPGHPRLQWFLPLNPRFNLPESQRQCHHLVLAPNHPLSQAALESLLVNSFPRLNRQFNQVVCLHLNCPQNLLANHRTNHHFCHHLNLLLIQHSILRQGLQ